MARTTRPPSPPGSSIVFQVRRDGDTPVLRRPDGAVRPRIKHRPRGRFAQQPGLHRVKRPVAPTTPASAPPKRRPRTAPEQEAQ